MLKRIWLASLLVVVAAAAAFVWEMQERQPSFTYNGTFELGVAEDGSYFVHEVYPLRQPPAATVKLSVINTRGPRPGWKETDWTLSIDSVSPLPQAQRAAISKLVFQGNGFPVPAEALTKVPKAGTSSTSGTQRTVQYGELGLSMLLGAPGFLLAVWVAIGLGLWLVPARKPGFQCEACGYSRSGLQPEAPCPECGSPPSLSSRPSL